MNLDMSIASNLAPESTQWPAVKNSSIETQTPAHDAVTLSGFSSVGVEMIAIVAPSSISLLGVAGLSTDNVEQHASSMTTIRAIDQTKDSFFMIMNIMSGHGRHRI